MRYRHERGSKRCGAYVQDTIHTLSLRVHYQMNDQAVCTVSRDRYRRSEIVMRAVLPD